MTKIVTVTKADTSKGGAHRVYFDNAHDWKDAYYVSKKIPAPPVGATISVNTASNDYQGKTYWYLNGWETAKTDRPMVPTPNGVRPIKSAGWDLETKDCAIILEVILKAAFDKGLVNDADDLYSWGDATYRLIGQLSSGKVQDFNDKIQTGTTVTEAVPDNGVDGDDFAPDF
jgi:hypothetical protein